MTYDSLDLEVGTRVRSHFKAPWTGYVLEKVRSERDTRYRSHKNHLVVCMITHDRHGNPMRKPKRSMTLSTYWLEAIKET